MHFTSGGVAEIADTSTLPARGQCRHAIEPPISAVFNVAGQSRPFSQTARFACRAATGRSGSSCGRDILGTISGFRFRFSREAGTSPVRLAMVDHKVPKPPVPRSANLLASNTINGSPPSRSRQVTDAAGSQLGQAYDAQPVVAADPLKFFGSPQVFEVIHGQIGVHVAHIHQPERRRVLQSATSSGSAGPQEPRNQRGRTQTAAFGLPPICGLNAALSFRADVKYTPAWVEAQ